MRWIAPFVVTGLVTLACSGVPDAPEERKARPPRGGRAPAAVYAQPGTDRVWQLEVGDATVRFSEAKSGCAALVLDGHDDWRLPTRDELASLIVRQYAEPPFDAGALPGTPRGRTWTQSVFCDLAGHVSLIDFADGLDTSLIPESDKALGYTRCVRTPDPPRPRECESFR